MSASTLRAAAALIRQRAHDASASPWTVDSGPEEGADVICWLEDDDPDYNGTAVAAADICYGACNEPDAAYIASWHPTVALAVADLIDTILKVGPVDGGAEWDATVNLARTYLGGSA
jgi:hypothetical protein